MENHNIPIRNLPQRTQPEGCSEPKKGERRIAVDATGFGTQNFVHWRNQKPGHFRQHDWLKLHAAVTSVLKAIPSMEVTDAYKSDAVQLGNLLESLHIDDVEAVAADSAYLSRRNCDAIEAIGAEPFIKPKCNVKGKSHGSFAWRKMIYNYRRHPEEWKRVYGFRSSAECAFSALKRKFGYRLWAIRKDLQRKELMIKVIVYNINILARITI